MGGSPAKLAVHVAKLGRAAAPVAKTGIGAFGTFVKGELQAAGVNTDYLIMDHRVHTSVVFIAQSRETPDFEVLRAGDAQLETGEIPEEAVREARIVHTTSFALSRPPARDAVERAVFLAEEHGRPVSLDPNFSPKVWPEVEEARSVLSAVLARITLCKRSLDDCHRFFGDEADPESYLERFHQLGPTVVVLTMGRKGMLLSDAGAVSHVLARRVEAVDATGDAFWAGFLIALLDGNSLPRGVLFAREVVERKLITIGMVAGPIDRDEIYAALP